MNSTFKEQLPERAHPRVETHLTVNVLIGDESYPAQAVDLSMTGCRLVDVPFTPSRRFELVIPLPEDEEVRTGCDVRRRDDDTIAVEFDPLDWDDLLKLARFLHPRLP